ncbi:MAG: hypothetical protein KGL16_07545, partial [Acidobacteriota bacterium]|nr:hypothetical protein [Acidobacteriota bacterium]
IDYPATHMSPAKVAVACGLVALLVSACGIPIKPEAGTAHLRQQAGFYGHTDDPRIPQVKCLRSDGLPFHQYYADGVQHLPAIQVGSRPQGPTIIFYATAGIAQGLQIQGKETGAAAIGSLLVYPNRAGGTVLSEVRACAAIGVVG